METNDTKAAIKAFSLPELLVVLVIISILVLIDNGYLVPLGL